MSLRNTVIIGFTLTHNSNGLIEIKRHPSSCCEEVSSMASKDVERIFQDIMKESQSMIAEKVEL